MTGAALKSAQMLENAAQAANGRRQCSGVLTDESLWETQPRSQTALAAGKATFDTMCASCHKPDL